MIKKSIYNFFGNLINLNLYLIKQKYKSKLIYNKNASFGESIIFNILHYDLIINKKKNLLFLVVLKKKLQNFFLIKNIYVNLL